MTFEKADPLGPLCLFALVFPTGGQAAPDVPLLPVPVQKGPNLTVEQGIALGKPLTQVLVDCGFGDSEVLRRGPYGGPGIDHVHSQRPGPVFHVVRHQIPLRCCVLGRVYEGFTLDRTAPGA